MSDHFRPCDTSQLRQIGRMNIAAISGGRVIRNGYSVTVDLDASDTYVVRRVFKRGAKTWIKGERTYVYFDEVGETAYQASCFRNGEFA